MISSVKRLWAWLHTHEGKKIFRYSMVSAISTAVSFVVLGLVYGVFKLPSEVLATVIANCVATFPSYWLNRKWAWGKTGKSHFMKEVVPFWIMAGLGIVVSIFGAAIAHHYGVKHHLNHTEMTALVLAANVVSFGVFWILKLLVFNKLFRQELEEFEEHLEIEESAESAQVH